MKKTSFVVIILFISLTSVKLFSQIAQLEPYKIYQDHYSVPVTISDKIHSFNPASLEYSSRLFPQHNFMTSSSIAYSMSSADSNVAENEGKVNPNRKSVWIGAGLSALVPGAGEYYAKSYVKSAIFFGIELICWGSYLYFNHKGNTTTDDFQNFANANWDVRRYARWLVNQGFPENGNINPDEPNLETLRAEINICEEANFSHTLPDYYTQQYYELIGKYQNFQAGWVGADLILTKQNYETVHLPIFINYADERQKANNYYNDATTGAMVALLNHLISAADAAWSVSIFNKKLDVQTGMEIRTYLTPYTYQTKPLPTMNIKVSF